VEELSSFPNCVLDGELVVMGDELELLPDGCDPDPVARFIVFDILQEDGQDTTLRPLSDRRQIMELLVPGGCYVARSPVFEDGEKLLDYVREHGLEGVVAKQNASRYVEGGRGDTWVKTKIRLQDEYLVVGYTPGEGSRAGTFGALILGRYDVNGSLIYSGKVGTGFTSDILQMLSREMGDLRAVPIPGDFPRDVIKEGVGVDPQLIVEIAYQRKTEDGLLWHPSYQGRRDDKLPRDVVEQ
jgi:bifunctional non-homologous end joining protein LigD